jgi:hypothetical protein
LFYWNKVWLEGIFWNIYTFNWRFIFFN